MAGLIKRFHKLLRSEAAAVAALVAVSLMGTAGLLAAAVDLGVVYTARAELQNAADSSALAGAATLIVQNGSGALLTQPSVAIATAAQYAAANKALGVSLTMRTEDLTMGFWDSQTHSFDPNRIGPSGNPDDLNAVQVTLRRDKFANSPVTTYFARILGINEVQVTATATAILGYPGKVPGAVVDLPIAVHKDAVGDGNGPTCGKNIIFRSEQTEQGEWTTFFAFPANDVDVRKYVTGQETIPELKVGDPISEMNGQLSQGTFQALKSRFESEKKDEGWLVFLPVVDPGADSSSSVVDGFMYFMITDVRDAPDKEVHGYMKCGVYVPGSVSGGGNYGARAAIPVLAR